MWAQNMEQERITIFSFALLGNSIFHFTNELYNMHPAASLTYTAMSLETLVNRFNNYGRGVVFVLMKHSLYFEAIKICFRGAAGSIVNALKGNFKLSYVYFKSFLARIQMIIFLFANKVKK
ncbi:hypothetical protein OKW96_04400 [Sphingobacterium sp. KU25419]|nr:hypothetical protein OKW96_04400 [Sphingobacterium sp. KU25419]